MGGAEIQLLSLVHGLNKTEFDVTVAVFYRGEKLDTRFQSAAGIKVIFFDKKHALDFLFLFRLFKAVRRARFDVLQAINTSARFFGLLAAVYGRIPVRIMTERTASLLYPSMGSRIYQFLEKYTNRFATLLIANSQAGRAFAVSRGISPQRLRVIYNGLDPDQIKVRNDRKTVFKNLGIPDYHRLVGMVARIEPEKDPLTFVEAAKKITAEEQHVSFVLVGGGPLFDRVKSHVDQQLPDGNFYCVGYHENAADFIDSMDILVLTSSEIEGCSNSILEAMNFGKPVVATKVGGTAEIVMDNKTGYLIDPRSPGQLAEKVIALLRDETLRRQMGKNARHFAKSTFTQKIMVNAYEAVYFESTQKGKK
jgi:glycosyltransferase involved in cell wall biosynthesis